MASKIKQGWLRVLARLSAALEGEAGMSTVEYTGDASASQQNTG